MTANQITLVYTSWCVERGDTPLRLQATTDWIYDDMGALMVPLSPL